MHSGTGPAGSTNQSTGDGVAHTDAAKSDQEEQSVVDDRRGQSPTIQHAVPGAR